MNIIFGDTPLHDLIFGLGLLLAAAITVVACLFVFGGLAVLVSRNVHAFKVRVNNAGAREIRLRVVEDGALPPPSSTTSTSARTAPHAVTSVEEGGVRPARLATPRPSLFNHLEGA